MSDNHDLGLTSCETCRHRYESSLYDSLYHCLVYNGKAGRAARDRVRAHYLSVLKSSGHVPTFDAIKACPEHEEGKPVCIEIGMAKGADHARRMRSMLADFWANVVRIDDKSIVIDIAGEVVRVEVMP